MAKQLNVSLAFSADTSQAQKSIQNLQTSLAKISSMKIGDNLQLKEASDAAKMLSYHLNQAYNASTGNIDLSALNHSLQKSSTNVTQLSNKLLQAGSNGQQAFVNLAQAISSAEYPMFKLGKRLTEFGNTLKNTIRWQFSSSLLHGMMGAYQQAIGYAEDLNASLTNIRVVTGNSTEEMARFAEYANKAAKSLSTTTTAYTDAALIFYQQGLGDKDVKERTDITVKMANVTGESVTTVSDQLTAIWNNFNKEGDIAYEHYADVLTALGAKTASSTDEIAGGLEKFAAIADTIGLSYEYAAAALATITSNTRQSEEVVGTALKTIFARLQGLKLGETLEDGTDLNKYSEALQKVGVEVLDASGELRRADDILKDMAARWETLSNAEQVALAQAVGGVRQYNQIVALMDEWDSGDADSMLANLETAYNADGALQEQADIWAESWEAAQKRVKAAAEGVYDSILDDKLFIGFNNVFADMLSGLEQVIDGVGGLKGVFIGVGSFIMSLIAHKVQPALTNFVLNIKAMFSSAQAQAAALTGELQSKVSTELSKTGDNAYDASQKQALSNANNLAEARTRLTLVSKNLTEQEKLLYQFDISLIEQDAQKAQSIADEITAIERERDALYQSIDATQEKIAINQIYDQELKSLMETQSMWKAHMDDSYAGGTEQEQVESSDEYGAARQAVDEYIASKQTLNSIIENTTQAIMDEYTGQQYAVEGFEKGAGVLQAFTNNLSALSNELGDTNRQFSANEVDKYKRQLDLFGKTLDNLQGITADTKKELAQLFAQAKASKDSKTMQSNIAKIISKIRDLKFTSEQLKDMGISLSPSQFKKFLANLEDGKRKEKELTAIQDELNNKMNNFNPSHMISGLERLTSAASAMGSVAMMGQSISSMINSWSNADLSFGEKLSTTFMSLSMLIPGTISAIKGLNTALQGTAAQQALVSAAMKLTTKDSDIATAKTILLTKAKGDQLTVEQKAAVSKGVLAAALAAEDISLDKNTLATVKNKVAAMVLNGAKKEEIVAYLATIPGITAETAAKIANKLATDALKTSIMGLLGPIGLIIAAVTAAVAIFTALAKAQEEAKQKTMEYAAEAAKTSHDQVKKNQEERDSINQLYSAYLQNQHDMDGSATAKANLRKSTEELCAALGIEIDKLDLLQGRYEQINKEIAQAQRDSILSEIQAIDEDLETNQNALGHYLNNNTYLGMKDSDFDYLFAPDQGATDLDESKMISAFDEYMIKALSLNADDNDGGMDHYIADGIQLLGGFGTLSFDESRSEEVLNAIEGFVNYVKDPDNGVDITGSEFWTGVESLVEGVQEYRTNIEESSAEKEKLILDLVNAELAVAGSDTSSIKDIESYNTYRDNMVNEVQSYFTEMGLLTEEMNDDYFTSLVDNYLSGFGFLTDLVTSSNAMDDVYKRSVLSKDILDELQQKYSDVFFDSRINFDEIKSKEDLENLLKVLQAEADAKSIQAKIDIVDNAKGNLKEDMSYGDYMDYESSSGIKWGQFDEDLKQNILDYTSFLQMTYDEQVAYLNSVQKLYQAEQAKTLSTNANASQTLLNNYAKEYNALNAKIANNEEANRQALALLNQIKELEDEMSNMPAHTRAYEMKQSQRNDYKAQHRALVKEYGADNILSEAELNRMFELENLIESTQTGLNTLDAQLKMVVSDILLSTTSVAELEAATMDLLKAGVSIDYNIYGEALIRLASEYDNCTNEIKEFEAALLGSNTELKIAKQEALEAAIAIGEAAKEYGVASDTVEDVADAFEALAESGEDQYAILKEDGEALADASVRYVRLNEAVLDLADNYEDYKKVLKDVQDANGDLDKAMVANSKSGKALQKSLADLLGTSEDFIDADLLDAIDPSDFEAAAKGDEKAIERIRDAFIELQATANDIDVSKLKDELSQLEEGKVIDISANTQPFLFALLQAQIDAGATAAEIEALLSGFNIDADVSDFVGSMDEMAAASADAATEVIANTSYSQEVEPTTVETPVTNEEISYSTSYVPETITSDSLILKNGADEPVLVPETRTSWVKSVTSDVSSTEATDTTVGTSVTTSNAAGETGQVKGVQIKNAHRSSGSSVGSSTKKTATETVNNSGGGGGSAPKKTPRTHQTEVVDRYKKINDQIEQSKKAMNDASRAAEGLWGKARLKEMEKVRAEMATQLRLLRQRKAEAETDLVEDQAWLNETAQEYGLTFTFNSDNTLANYYEIMDGLHAELRQAEIDAGDLIDKDGEQEKIDLINEKIAAIEKAVGIYEATRQEIEETDTAIKDMVRSIQEANLEELNIKLEFEIMVDDSQLEKLDYYLGKVNDSIWGMAEAAALMTGKNAGLFGFDMGQADVWYGKFETFQQRYNDLVQAYTTIDPKTGETFINQEQFVKALSELQSDIYSNLNNINELDKTMISYYGDTLAKAAEELSQFTDMMDHHNDVLDHYMSLMEIMGKSKDFERLKLLAQTQVDVAANSAEVSKANYEALQVELAEKKAAYEAFDPNDTSLAAQTARQAWIDAQTAVNEAQIKMLEDAEAWAEALKALLETELEELGENLEKALAGEFGSLDYLMTSMERANSLQEEYLTTTNKIYETNKLMRSAQQEIDKTSNSVAKRRMAQFIQETQQLQNQNKLSNYELEIQQAKYDLLLAEIALEEAQSAKSTVRLTRDNEGNFGYVYTADQNQVAEAQQQLEDAQNALYNIGLEGANKYAEQYAQTIQEMNDAVRELTEQWQNGEIASKDEYQAKMLELEKYYGEKLKEFSHLHSIAVQTDSRVANEAWTRDFAHMTTQTEYWMTQVSGYAQKVGEAFGRYQQGIDQVEQYAGADLESLKTKTENIKTENENLVKSITDPDKGLLAAMQKEIDKVDEITKKYLAWRKEIQGAITDQQTLAGIIGQTIENESDDDESNDLKPTNPNPEPTPEPEPNPTPEPEPEGNELKTYQTGKLTWTGNGSARIWKDSTGKTYKASSNEGVAIQTAFNKAFNESKGYSGDYFLGWNTLNADVLHERYGLATGGYTGDWAGPFGKLAFLHQKELVLNKEDTSNLLAAMEFLNRITSIIDLQAMNSSLGGLLSSPSLGQVGNTNDVLEQQVHIEASFPGVSDRNELEEAFNNLINQAAQYANR